MTYGIMIFFSDRMLKEFERFRLKEFAGLVGFLELSGAAGLIVGLLYYPVLLVASGGLAILMLLGFAIRIKIKDSFLLSLPALFLMVVNFYIFVNTINLKLSI